ncbi:reverse transcriptase domain-containing protein [Piscinibacter gummiphilus]|uniref:Reverse transcriptase domain-containing protein n=1 Tax=Piscinibacter gummiphilus TaxID=946333 RepID=A0ABZ0CR63_9BURK|nr:reverse transcriptase domain-containing protein [Piscinibacter gummiphilus]WOB07490.1 reverse transcriptase domain-containing protein [Piscinibacter gummiphilus]
MVAPPSWSNRFELKAGRWVFEPTTEARAKGLLIKAAIQEVWKPPKFFYHLRSGGHVAALRAHLDATVFARVDIEDFFGSVNRSRVTRSLKSRFSYLRAREMARDSVVNHPTAIPQRFILPYGFVQSPLLASLALFDSALGTLLCRFAKTSGLNVSVYVDDIIISGTDALLLQDCLAQVEVTAAKSGFSLNAAKTMGPSASITAFNIDLAHSDMQVESARYNEFVEAFAATSNPAQQAGIAWYVHSVNTNQAKAFLEALP